MECPGGPRPADSRPHLGEDAIRGRFEDAAALEPDGRLREEARHLVAEAQGAAVGADGGDDAAAPVADAALDLEQVGEVGRAAKPQLAADRLRRRVEDLDLLQAAVAHEPQAAHCETVGGQAGRVRVRQEEGCRVVVDRPGLEQRERRPVQPEFPAAEKARVFVHETSDGSRRHVAERVREHERPPLEDGDCIGTQLDGAGPLVRQCRRRPRLRIRVERSRAPLERRCLAAGASLRGHGERLEPRARTRTGGLDAGRAIRADREYFESSGLLLTMVTCLPG